MGTRHRLALLVGSPTSGGVAPVQESSGPSRSNKVNLLDKWYDSGNDTVDTDPTGGLPVTDLRIENAKRGGKHRFGALTSPAEKPPPGRDRNQTWHGRLVPVADEDPLNC